MQKDGVAEFAEIMDAEIKKRYTREQMKTMLILSYFDPVWRGTCPAWIKPGKGFRQVDADVRRETKLGVIELWRGF